MQTRTHIRDTSLRAHDALIASGAAQSKSARILEAVWEIDQFCGLGLTLQEICRNTGLQINAVSGRVNEMKNRAVPVLWELPKRICSVTGNQAHPVTAYKPGPEQLELM